MRRFRNRKIGVVPITLVCSSLLISLFLFVNRRDRSTGKGDPSKAKVDVNAANRALVHYEASRSYLNQDNIADAIIELRAAISLDPKNPKYHANLGMEYHRQRKYKRAREEYEQAIQLDPNSVLYRYNLGYLYLKKLHDYEKAEKQLRLVLGADPTYPLAHQLLAEALDGMLKYKEAEQALMGQLKLDPNNALAYHELGCVYEKLGEFQRAETMFKKSVALDPADLTFHYRYAQILQRNGKKDKARREFAKHKELHDLFTARKREERKKTHFEEKPEPGESNSSAQKPKYYPCEPADHYRLGSGFEEAGKLTDALAQYKRAVQLAPNNSLYQKSYDSVKSRMREVKAPVASDQ